MVIVRLGLEVEAPKLWNSILVEIRASITNCRSLQIEAEDPPFSDLLQLLIDVLFFWIFDAP